MESHFKNKNKQICRNWISFPCVILLFYLLCRILVFFYNNFIHLIKLFPKPYFSKTLIKKQVINKGLLSINVISNPFTFQKSPRCNMSELSLPPSLINLPSTFAVSLEETGKGRNFLRRSARALERIFKSTFNKDTGLQS